MKRLLHAGLLAATLLAFSAPGTRAQSDSPVGQWRTIDDETGEPRSIVEIYEEEDGTLQGRVVQILMSSNSAERNSEGQIICSACDGEREGQPIEGMTILWGLEKDGDEWDDGRILDPSNGKTYKAKMELDGSDRLEVRGYLGVSLFGRTQTWQRLDASVDSSGAQP